LGFPFDIFLGLVCGGNRYGDEMESPCIRTEKGCNGSSVLGRPDCMDCFHFAFYQMEMAGKNLNTESVCLTHWGAVMPLSFPTGNVNYFTGIILTNITRVLYL